MSKGLVRRAALAAGLWGMGSATALFAQAPSADAGWFATMSCGAMVGYIHCQDGGILPCNVRDGFERDSIRNGSVSLLQSDGGAFDVGYTDFTGIPKTAREDGATVFVIDRATTLEGDSIIIVAVHHLGNYFDTYTFHTGMKKAFWQSQKYGGRFLNAAKLMVADCE